jgi:hypothetical protein
MKKKSKVLMIALVAAVSMFSVVALASSPSTAGYETFKEVLKGNPMSGEMIESATVKGNFTVTVDGETVLYVDGTAMVEDAGDEHSMNNDFDFTLMGVERSGSVYSNGDEGVYLVDRTNDLHYQVINLDDEHASKNDEWLDEDDFHDRSMTKAEEALLDFFVGDLKDNFSVMKHADDSKTITVDVSKEEIPLPLRLLMDVASTGDKSEHTHTSELPAELERLKQFPFFQGFEGIDIDNHLPELTKDVGIERVRLQLTVDANNELQGVQVEFEVSGKDDAGVAHLVEIEGAAKFSGINMTTPDLYDPSGKSLEIIDAAAFDDRG